MPIILALEHYDSIRVHFEPKNSGGFFPCFNISGCDLIIYGIYLPFLVIFFENFIVFLSKSVKYFLLSNRND